MNQSKRKLKIDLVDLESAFEYRDFSMELDYFLDLETGEMVLVTGEARRLLEDVYEEYADPDTGEVDWPTILPNLDIPEWQKETLPVADGVEAGFGTRYIRIPQIESYEGYNDMVAFIETYPTRAGRTASSERSGEKARFADSRTFFWTIRRNASAGSSLAMNACASAF